MVFLLTRELYIPRTTYTLEEIHSSWYGFVPNLSVSIFAVVVFTLLTGLQVGQGFYYKQRWLAFAWCCGLFLQVTGYSARLASYYYLSSTSLFILQTLAFNISHIFIRAGLYYKITQIYKLFDENMVTLSPRSFACIFIAFDIFALFLQILGGAFVISGRRGRSLLEQVGKYVIIVGAASQVVTILVFLILVFAMSRSVNQLSKYKREHKVGHFSESLCARLVMPGLVISSWLMFIVSLCWMIEFWNGFHGKNARSEWYHLVFGGMLILFVCIIITALYPGRLLRPSDPGDELLSKCDSV